MMDDCFTSFKQTIEDIPLPERFTFPFYYEPHELSRLAANELQDHLKTQRNWVHNFGLNTDAEGDPLGKMFGVLVVQKPTGEVGYLSAFSGKLAERSVQPGFVPSFFDRLEEGGFFRLGEEALNEINRRIKDLEEAPEMLRCQEAFNKEEATAKQEIEACRIAVAAAKQQRKRRREEGRPLLTEEAYAELEKELKNESIRYHFELKDLKKSWRARLLNARSELDSLQEEIRVLKAARKVKSAALQQQLFDQYQFLNSEGEKKGIQDIFQDTIFVQPPSGAGDCAAPKLLQYAFQHNLKPLAMAEFWWGVPPSSAIRKHGNFYPSCRGKCEPILAHMLKGIPMDENPLRHNPTKVDELEVVYEDEALLLINKPSGFLSVPGKQIRDSVFLRMKQQYPESSGPLIVHRLDLSTSGLMVIAKTKAVHKHLQQQFIKRTIKKRYVALLDGLVEEDRGTIDLPLRVDLDDRPRQLVCYEHGKAARTHWEVVNREGGNTRVHFYPRTGRTHQLRVHAAHPKGLNVPIVGDDLYGTKSERLHLHAAAISFVHPATEREVSFEKEAEF